MCDDRRWNTPLQGCHDPYGCWNWLASKEFQTEFQRQQDIDNPYPTQVFRERTNDPDIPNWEIYVNNAENQQRNEDVFTMCLFAWCSIIRGTAFTIGDHHYWLLGYKWPTKGDQNRSPIADLVGLRPDGGLTVFECKVDADKNKNLCAVICEQALAYLSCLTGATNFHNIHDGFETWRRRKANDGQIPVGFEDVRPCHDARHEAIVLATHDWFNGYHEITDEIRNCVQARSQSRVAIGFAATTFIKTTNGEWMDR